MMIGIFHACNCILIKYCTEVVALPSENMESRNLHTSVREHQQWRDVVYERLKRVWQGRQLVCNQVGG